MWKVQWKSSSLRHVWLFVTSWTITYQAPLSLGFSRQEYWGGLPFPSLAALPDPGIEAGLPHGRQIVCHLSHQIVPVVLKVKVKVTQSGPTHCNPMDCSPPGPLSLEFSRQEYWSGVPFPSPGDFPDPGIASALLADSEGFASLSLQSDPYWQNFKLVFGLLPVAFNIFIQVASDLMLNSRIW